jgi:LytR cell envelope-related transcriptional attenuator
VEHPVSSPELVRPWRTATLVATAIAGIELVLLIVAGMVLLGRSLAPHVHAAAQSRAHSSKPKPAAVAPHRPAAKPHHTSRAVALLPRARTGLLVLNGNGVSGAAASAASLATARGYLVKRVGNAPRSGYARSIVEYRPGYRAEALRFSRDLNVGVVSPLDGMRPAALHGAKIVLILGASH